MASNLRVDTILPSTGTTLGIGTASGTINFLGNSNITTTGSINAASATITGNLGVGGVLTYEDVTNVDSVGLITARSGINVSGGEVKVGTAVTVSSGGVITSGIVTATSFSGSGANLTGIVSGLFSSYAIICDQKAANVTGGTSLTGQFRNRDLNTELLDPDNIVSISNNHFILQAGTYYIQWTSPFYESGRGATELVTVANSGSGSATRIAIGACAWSGATDGSVNHPVVNSRGWHRVTIGSETYFAIRYQCGSSVTTYGLGVNATYTDSIYTVVEIYKEA